MRSDFTHHALHPCTGPGPRPWRGRARTAGQVAERVLGLGAREHGPRQRLHLAAAHALRQQLVHLPHLRVARVQPRSGALFGDRGCALPLARMHLLSPDRTPGELRPVGVWMRARRTRLRRDAPSSRLHEGGRQGGRGAGARAWSCMTPLKSESRSMPWKEMLACSGRMPSGVFFRMSYLPISSSCPCGARQRTVACSLSSARLFSAMSTPRPPVCAPGRGTQCQGLAGRARSDGRQERIGALRPLRLPLICAAHGRAKHAPRTGPATRERATIQGGALHSESF